jgi:hypothetical protein
MMEDPGIRLRESQVSTRDNVFEAIGESEFPHLVALESSVTVGDDAERDAALAEGIEARESILVERPRVNVMLEVAVKPLVGEVICSKVDAERLDELASSRPTLPDEVEFAGEIAVIVPFLELVPARILEARVSSTERTAVMKSVSQDASRDRSAVGEECVVEVEQDEGWRVLHTFILPPAARRLES